LDRTLGAEKVWLLVGDAPFAFDVVREAALREWRRLGAPEQMDQLPLDLSQTGLLFFKERAP
jgi:hypothetical protein